jgi:NitT/TauT family transport system substrate-binding protein
MLDRGRRLHGVTATLVSVAAIAGLAFTAPSASAQPKDRAKIHVLLPTGGAASMFTNFVATELGFYEAENLEVVFDQGGDTTVPVIAFLVNKQVDMTMLDSPQVLQAVNAGQPVSVVYEVMQYAPERIVVTKESPIQSMADLKGKTVGLASDRDQITLQIMLDFAGMSVDDVKSVVVGDSAPTLAKSLQEKTIDAFVGGPNDANGIEIAGVALRNITPSEVSENPGNSFVILSTRAEEIREPLTRFLRAYSKANNAALLGYKTIASIWKKNRPSQWENMDAGYKMLDIAAYQTTLARTHLRGEPQPDVWAAIQPPYIKLGEIKEFIDPAKFIDDSFIQAANDYKTSEVKEAIKKWREANKDILVP